MRLRHNAMEDYCDDGDDDDDDSGESRGEWGGG